MPETFVQSLGPMPKATSLQLTLERAFVYAEEQAHRQVSLEHLLLALTEDADGIQVLRASNIDISRLRDEVASFVGLIDDRLPADSEDPPIAAEELLRILDYAAAAAEQSGRRTLDGAIVLAALIGEGKSPAAELLKSHGLTFETAIRTLQNRQPASAARKAPPQAPPRRFQRRPEAAPGAAKAPQPASPVAPELVEEQPAQPAQSRPREGVARTERPTGRPLPHEAAAAAAPKDADDADGYAAESLRPAREPRVAPVRRPDPAVGRINQVPRARVEPAAEIHREGPTRRQPAAASAAGRKPAPKSAAKPAERGLLVENIPRRMRVSVPEQVEVRVSRRQLAQMSEGLRGRGAPVAHDVYVTQAMSVRLRAPGGGFFIETASPETQWVDERIGLGDNEPASWRWTVTPKARGKRKLQVVVAARTVNNEGINADTPLPEQTIEVSVATNYGIVAKRSLYWLLAMLFGGAIGAFGEQAIKLASQYI